MLDVARAQLSNAGLAELFEGIYSADEVRALKPAPAPYLMVAERCGVDIGERVSGRGARLGCLRGVGRRRTGRVRGAVVAWSRVRLGAQPAVIGADLTEVADALLAPVRQRGGVNGCQSAASFLACLTVGVSVEWLFEPSAGLSPARTTSGGPPHVCRRDRYARWRDGALTARGMVNALTKTGFAVPNPMDTTAQECPAAGCDQSIVTDTLRVKSFCHHRRGRDLCRSHGLFQVETIVVAFAPPVSQAEQDRYRAQIQTLMQ